MVTTNPGRSISNVGQYDAADVYAANLIILNHDYDFSLGSGGQGFNGKHIEIAHDIPGVTEAMTCQNNSSPRSEEGNLHVANQVTNGLSIGITENSEVLNTNAIVEESNKPPFGLFDLTPELLLRVFEFLVASRKAIRPVELCASDFVEIKRLDFSSVRSLRTAKSQPPITRVSRKIRDLTLPLYYRENEFVLHGTIIDAGCPFPWFRFPSPSSTNYLRQLRTVRCFAFVVDLCPTEEHPEADMWFKITVTLSLKITAKTNRIYIRPRVGKNPRIAACEEWQNAIKSFMDRLGGGEIDGLSLLQLAVMVQQGIRFTDPSFELRKQLLATK